MKHNYQKLTHISSFKQLLLAKFNGHCCLRKPCFLLYLNKIYYNFIDYIRTFTWDKRLETYVKSSGFLGGQGKMPTIVSPEVYRNRFLEAMEKYFHVVPDRWSKFPYFYPVKM